MEHAALDGAAQRLGVDHQSAVVRAHQPLHPDVAGLAIHLDLGDLRDDRLVAERVRDAASGQNVSRCRVGFGEGRGIPAVRLRRRLEHRDGTRALEPAVVGGAGREQLHAELERVGLRRSRQSRR